MILSISIPFFLYSLAVVLIGSNPRQQTVIVITIASLLTIWLVLPVSLVPSTLFHALRPFQTFISTSVISFGLALQPFGKWFEVILSVISLLLTLLNTWSFAQFDGTIIFICGLSGSLCYITVILETIIDVLGVSLPDPTKKSREHISKAL